jgi:hypothetical protein
MMMKPDHACESDSVLHPAAESVPEPRKPWSPPSVSHLRAGLAESGPNINFDGVEGTS